MIHNLTLIFLTLQQIYQAPLISMSPNFHPIQSKFENIGISFSFRSFFYLSNQFDFHLDIVSVRNSLFSHFLDSTLFINSFSNMKYTIQNEMVADPTNLAIRVDLDGCCFESCSTTLSLQDGGAIHIIGADNSVLSQALLNITNCGFFNCRSSRNGGAIFFHGMEIYLENSEFSRCQATDSGIIYMMFNSSIFYSQSSLKYIDINNCQSKGAIHANTLSPNYLYLNFSSCINPDMQNTYPVCYSFVTANTYNNLQYLNIFENTGNIILQYEFSRQYDNIYDIPVKYFNIIENKANIIFNLGSPLIHVTGINMFKNVAASSSGLIPINAVDPTGIVKLHECNFDLDEATVKANCPNFVFDTTNCFFSVTTPQTLYYTYIDNYHFINPFDCIQRVPPTETFSLSLKFTPSSRFTNSDTFSASKSFTASSIFTASIRFTSSLTFTSSSVFTDSDHFKPSQTFTPSLTFTPTNSFTATVSFSPSSPFSPSSEFTTSSEFTASFNALIPTGSFTPSDSFTPSNFFTPNRTKYPDGIMRQDQADVQGSSIFSKEELKKAAGTASVSLVFIVVSVVASIFYFKRKMKEVLNPNNPPDFDCDDDDYDDDDSYSYSFYTYEYYSTDSCSGIVTIDQYKSQMTFGSGNNLMEPDNSQSYDEFTNEDIDIDVNVDFDDHVV